ncbi:hypothetical protein SCOR_04370 [Sulfidibacter corallicola]
MILDKNCQNVFNVLKVMWLLLAGRSVVSLAESGLYLNRRMFEFWHKQLKKNRLCEWFAICGRCLGASPSFFELAHRLQSPARLRGVV